MWKEPVEWSKEKRNEIERKEDMATKSTGWLGFGEQPKKSNTFFNPGHRMSLDAVTRVTITPQEQMQGVGNDPRSAEFFTW